MVNNILFLVNVQNDFCDPKGEVYVPGAYRAIMNLGYFIEDNFSKLSSVVSTFDWHPRKHVSFNTSWTNKKTGCIPQPFQSIYSKYYNHKGEGCHFEEKQYEVYPQHCLQYSWGAAPPRRISELVSHLPCVNLPKGKFIFRDELSPFTDFSPPTILLNKTVDNIYVAGIDVTQTVKDLSEYVNPEKIILVKDSILNRLQVSP